MPGRPAIEAAIAALQLQRALLGDAATDAAIAALRAQLPHASSGQLQHVSVLFVDVVGSTAMSRQLDPEDIVEVLDRALAGFDAQVQAHQGRVLQFTGDGLLAVFGDGASAEHGAENAVRAALAVLQHTRQLAAMLRAEGRVLDFDVRAGIHSGQVLLGAGVDAEGSIRGSAVNLAARMEQAAPKGGLRISHPTQALVRGLFELVEEDAIAVKGADAPMRTYLVRRAMPRGSGLVTRGIEGLGTPTIGREQPLQHLLDAFAARLAGEPGAAPCITVVADAGVGKSRLAAEFERGLRALDVPPLLLRACPQRQTLQQPYGLLRELLSSWLAIDEQDDAATVRDKLALGLAPWVGGEGEAALHLIGHLLGFDHATSVHLRGILNDPAQIRMRGFHALVDVLLRRARAAPGGCVLLLDDLHWADDASLDFLEQLWRAERQPPVPLLGLGLSRPSLLLRRPSWTVPAHRVSLATLGPQHRAELADALLRGVHAAPEALRQLLTDHGDGNPFFMEEIMRMLVDEGALVVDDAGPWRVVPERLSATRVPATLAGVLQARMAVLQDVERRALQQAAVIGYVHWDLAVAAVDPASTALLDGLSSREFIVPQSHSGLEGAREFQFQHHLMHQFAYESTLRRERRAYHAKVAAWLSARADHWQTDLHATLGEHHELAGELTRAVACFVRAAEDAAARGARKAAIEHASRGLALVQAEDHGSRWQLLLVREAALVNQEPRAAHDTDLQALVDLAEQLGDPAQRAEVGLRAAAAQIDHGDYLAGEATARVALQHARTAGDVTRQARALTHQSFAQRRLGDFDSARSTAQSGLDVVRVAGDSSALASLLQVMSGVCAESGDLSAGVAFSAESLALARASRNRDHEARTLTNMADTLMRLGRYPEAQECLQQGLQLAQRNGQVQLAALVRINMAAVAQLHGDNAIAADLARAAVADAVAIDARDLEAAALLLLGLAQSGLGQLALARQTLLRCAQLFAANASPHLALEAMAALALVSLAQGEPTRALVELEPVLAHVHGGGRFHGTEEPLRILLSAWQVLHVLADSRAPALLTLTHDELQARAARITDPQARRCFVEDVPHNRAIAQALTTASPT